MTLRLDSPAVSADDPAAPAPVAPELASPALAARAELDRPQPSYPSVVGWLSAHVAALEHVVYPAARRAGIDVGDHPALTRRLEHLLFQLHVGLNGDGRGTRVDGTQVVDRLRDVLRTHVDGLESMLADLEASLPAERWADLVDRHRTALRDAPSRPHPHTPHGRFGERLAFTVAGAVDRLLDALDSRVVPPLPRQRDAAPSTISAAAPSA